MEKHGSFRLVAFQNHFRLNGCVLLSPINEDHPSIVKLGYKKGARMTVEKQRKLDVKKPAVAVNVEVSDLP